MTDEKRKRAPTPRVIAAMWVLQQLDGDVMSPTLEREALAETSDSRISAIKGDKIRTCASKMTKALIKRCRGIVERFNNPQPVLPTGNKKLFGKKVQGGRGADAQLPGAKNP